MHRPAYSADVLEIQARFVEQTRPRPRFADIGAGTGKLTKMLVDMGFAGYAVEPNEAMRKVGSAVLDARKGVTWREGSGEKTDLEDGIVDWVFMASAFHWTDPARSLPEFRRILRKGGFLTLLWNPRDLEASTFQQRIEALINEIAPGIQRKSSGAKQFTAHLDRLLVQSGCFDHVVFMEASHVEVMSRERYLGAWKSVNDIQVQAGPEKFREIMAAIERETETMQQVEVPYRTRAWFAQRVD